MLDYEDFSFIHDFPLSKTDFAKARQLGFSDQVVHWKVVSGELGEDRDWTQHFSIGTLEVTFFDPVPTSNDTQ